MGLELYLGTVLLLAATCGAQPSPTATAAPAPAPDTPIPVNRWAAAAPASEQAEQALRRLIK